MIAKRSFERLDARQKEVLLAAAKKSEDYFFAESKKLDDAFVETFQKAGVQVVTMTPEQVKKWQELAKSTSYKTFAEKVPGGQAPIDMALAVP